MINRWPMFNSSLPCTKFPGYSKRHWSSLRSSSVLVHNPVLFIQYLKPVTVEVSMKKILVTIVLSTFLLSMPVPSEASERNSSSEEKQTNALPVSAVAPAALQSIGIGRRRTVRRRRRVMRRMVRRNVRRTNRGRHLRRGAYMRRSVRGRRHPRALRLRVGVPRRAGIGVRSRRRGY